MRKLTTYGLLEKVAPDTGYYAITDTGHDYLAGEVARDELETQAE